MTHKKPYILGAIILLIGLGARFSIGQVYSAAEATDLLQTLSNAGLYLGSAIATASATTLALMLTLLGLTKNSDSEFGTETYSQISQVATFATLALVTSIILLMAFVMPVGEFEKMPKHWYGLLYNGLFLLVVIVCALMVTTIMQLFLTIRHVVAEVTPGDSV